MALPTQDALTTAVDDWYDTNIASGAIAANTDAQIQVAAAKDQLPIDLFDSIDDVSEAKAAGTLTSSANYANNDTVKIGSRTYTFQTALTNVDGNVKIGATEILSIANLHHAINGTGGVAGTDYATATTAHPDVTATDDGAHVVTVTAIVPGTDGNAIATTTTSATASWGAATLTGGSGDDADAAELIITNFREALRGGPLDADADASAQIDGAMAALNTAVIALYT